MTDDAQPLAEQCGTSAHATEALLYNRQEQKIKHLQQVIVGSERSGGPGGRTRCALLSRYSFGDDTIGSRGFIAAVTRTAGPRLFGGAGL